jgi:hypothetical protein
VGAEKKKNRNYFTLPLHLPFFQIVHVEWGAAAGSLSMWGVLFRFPFSQLHRTYFVSVLLFFTEHIFALCLFFSFLGGFVIWGRSRGERDLGEGWLG